MTPEPIELPSSQGELRHHVLSVLVENKAGVLSRVAGLFSRRGFNIFSLAVAPMDPSRRFSRITIVVDAASAPLSQIVNQLDKLINVVEISHVTEQSVVERELLLATVGVAFDQMAGALALCASFGAEVLDATASEVTVTLAAHPDQINAFCELLAAYRVDQLHRTGLVALPRLTTPPVSPASAEPTDPHSN